MAEPAWTGFSIGRLHVTWYDLWRQQWGFEIVWEKSTTDAEKAEDSDG